MASWPDGVERGSSPVRPCRAERTDEPATAEPNAIPDARGRVHAVAPASGCWETGRPCTP